MSNLNDVSMNPTGVQGAYPGVANPTSASMPKASDSYATEGDLSGHTSTTTRPSDSGEGRDVIEAQPGVIESTELAPLNDEIVAPDTTLLNRATGMAKQALRSAGADI
ncbi:hypothetical protein EHS25_003379 [Saitozyma podzolica]|uniref:Uncharacterized protein n=1 Tax=Saitozyma podzolica TaxID=1890683 RepID=A0A427Y8P1_9TREE|nr:hypothetical protein EHS25_003379 [Saitozyma podzolica]